MSKEHFLVQVDAALHPAGEGGEKGDGGEGLVWCCPEPPTGSTAEPLPVNGWLLAMGMGAWGSLGNPSSSWRHLEIDSGNLWGEHRGRRRGELISWKGLIIWKALSEVSRIPPICRCPAVMEEGKDDVAEWRQGRPFSDAIQFEYEVDPLKKGLKNLMCIRISTCG